MTPSYFLFWWTNHTKESSNDLSIRSSPSQIFCKISVPGNFGKVTGKHTCHGLTLNKMYAEKILKIHKKTPVLESCF